MKPKASFSKRAFGKKYGKGMDFQTDPKFIYLFFMQTYLEKCSNWMWLRGSYFEV
jgi:hypothetical protein